MKNTYLIQRLNKPISSDKFMFRKDNPFNFGGGEAKWGVV